MAVVINFICDNKDCKAALQPCAFDSETETWRDMLNCFKNLGWTFVMDGAKVVSCECPNH